MAETSAGTATVAEKVVDIKAEGDVVLARQAGRELAREAGFGSADQTRLATAISELVRNVIQHAGEGVCQVVYESDEDWARIRAAVEDHGPGIPDIDKAMTEGFSTARSMGVGLSASSRLVHEFDIKSEPGHTVVTVAMFRRKL
jgi:serine/threonine-protein kinase RsbT